MEIFTIFEDKLYAFRYDGEETDEFKRLFDLWFDIEYLEDFFEKNKSDLQNGFFGNVSVEDAVRKTRNEAKELEQELKRLASLEALEIIFKPLENTQYKFVELRKSKAKGKNFKSWLRLYGLRLAEGVYIITGGAIKLTATMEEREHTVKELAKISRCRDFCKDHEILDEGDISNFD
jgi:hypothetical protein